MTSCLPSSELLELIRPMACRLPAADSEISIRGVVSEILSCAQVFVPSEMGSILLAHPQQEGALVFVAAFGGGAEMLPGMVLSAGTGISGQVYLTGKPVLTNSPVEYAEFYNGIDRMTSYDTRSLLCVPLRAFDQSVGVLNLLNRKGGQFVEQDLELIDVFSHYLTQSIQLLLEAKRQTEAALRDNLSGLFNDRYLYRYLADIITVAVKEDFDVGLLFLDLDHFKSVVDSHGHLVGSQALRECGHLIGGIAAEFGAVPARYGGDEYVLVLPRCGQGSLLHLAERLRQEVEQAVLVCEDEGVTPVVLQGRITSSIGIATLSQVKTEGESAESMRQRLIRLADMAMYEAKARGKNRVYLHGS